MKYVRAYEYQSAHTGPINVSNRLYLNLESVFGADGEQVVVVVFIVTAPCVWLASE